MADPADVTVEVAAPAVADPPRPNVPMLHIEMNCGHPPGGTIVACTACLRAGRGPAGNHGPRPVPPPPAIPRVDSL
jgi:hypothetical protein